MSKLAKVFIMIALISIVSCKSGCKNGKAYIDSKKACESSDSY